MLSGIFPRWFFLKPFIQANNKISAAKERPELEKMISILRKGDVGELKFFTFTQICNGLVGWCPQSPTLHILKNAKHVNN